jgi:putative ABC transport system permease protein
MPDWKAEVHTRLASLNLSPTREAEIVDELSQHLDDRYRESIAGGASSEDATRLALAAFQNDNRLAQQMASPRRRSRRQRPPGIRSAMSGRTSATPRGHSESSRALPRLPC